MPLTWLSSKHTQKHLGQTSRREASLDDPPLTSAQLEECLGHTSTGKNKALLNDPPPTLTLMLNHAMLTPFLELKQAASVVEQDAWSTN